MTAKPNIVVTRRLPGPVEDKLAALGAVLNASDRPLGAEDLSEAMADCDILVPTLSDRLGADLIRRAGPRLKLIANFGAGTDHIDLAAARARGIAVTNTPGVLTEDTADVAMALILMTLRGLGEGERVLRAGRWSGWGPTDQLGRSLSRKTLAILGMGRIGQALARRAQAFGMKIIYNKRRRLSPEREEALGAGWRGLDDLLTEADVLSLNAPYDSATHHLIGRRELELMKRPAWLINAARGAIVDQEALIEALETGALAGAGFDVYPEEPEVDPRLVALPNVVLLPHLGSATLETRIAMGNKVLANIQAWIEGEELPDRIA
jgi:glyoxylate reductase